MDNEETVLMSVEETWDGIKKIVEFGATLPYTPEQFYVLLGLAHEWLGDTCGVEVLRTEVKELESN